MCLFNLGCITFLGFPTSLMWRRLRGSLGVRREPLHVYGRNSCISGIECSHVLTCWGFMPHVYQQFY